MDKPMILSVTELTTLIKQLIESEPALASVYVAGEVSNVKYHSSGHIYLTMKDSGSVLRAVMFRHDASKLRFDITDGMRVIAHGRVSVFPGAGQHQLYIHDLQPDGGVAWLGISPSSKIRCRF